MIDQLPGVVLYLNKFRPSWLSRIQSGINWFSFISLALVQLNIERHKVKRVVDNFIKLSNIQCLNEVVTLEHRSS